MDKVLLGLQNIASTWQFLSGKRPLEAAFLSVQKKQFCAQEAKSITVSEIQFSVLPDIADLLSQRKQYDLCVLTCHNENEEALLFKLRENNFAKLYFVWMWDNHHHFIGNLRTAVLADVVFPSHWHEHRYLSHPITVCGPHVPAYSRHWSANLICQLYPDGLPTIRSDAIFGGFGRYKWLPERNAFIESLMKQCPDHALSLVDVDSYFRLPVAERLASWTNHKVHLVVPVAGDVSSRIFGALMTGQIPLVPDNVPDLDSVVSPQLQQSLPILRWKHGSTESARAAWRDGIARFDSDGAVGVSRRYAFARDHHGLTARLQSFANFVRTPRQIALENNGHTVSWAEPVPIS